MAKNNNLTDFVRDLANTLRTRLNLSSSEKINPQDFSSKILTNIQTSGFPTITFDNDGGVSSFNVTFSSAPSIPSGYDRIYLGTAYMRTGTTYYSGVFRLQLSGSSYSLSGLLELAVESEYGSSNSSKGAIYTYIDSSYNTSFKASMSNGRIIGITPTKSFDIPKGTLVAS